MKDFKKSHTIADQSNVKVQKSHKHDANLQKNSSLYFQVGLILCLLATYGVFEMEFETKKDSIAILKPLDPENKTYDIPKFVIEPDAPKTKPVKLKEKVITAKLKIVKDIVPVALENLVSTPTPEPVDPNAFTEPTEPTEPVEPIFNMVNVEIVPIYPGCEKKKTNGERVKCMNQKLAKLIQRKFDTNLANELGLSGKQRINVQFKINQNGEITEILARAPHPSLEKEAERIANKIPQMKPGLQRQVPVSVIYNLPIVFKVNQ
ncbi:hypothetical protein A9Q86_05790 [Flavobacteriales bacterium 33_180_T64]|nr:hypothetical protein A9Q86_05790 [Flavobacteriales bacterium 33_180_T64]